MTVGRFTKNSAGFACTLGKLPEEQSIFISPVPGLLACEAVPASVWLNFFGSHLVKMVKKDRALVNYFDGSTWECAFLQLFNLI